MPPHARVKRRWSVGNFTKRKAHIYFPLRSLLGFTAAGEKKKDSAQKTRLLKQSYVHDDVETL